jgi:hypothetical protein
VEVESPSHDALAQERDTPATGAWNLGDKSTCVEFADGAADAPFMRLAEGEQAVGHLRVFCTRTNQSRPSQGHRSRLG